LKKGSSEYYQVSSPTQSNEKKFRRMTDD